MRNVYVSMYGVFCVVLCCVCGVCVHAVWVLCVSCSDVCMSLCACVWYVYMCACVCMLGVWVYMYRSSRSWHQFVNAFGHCDWFHAKPGLLVTE